MNDQEKKLSNPNEGASNSSNPEKINNIQQNTSNQLAEGIAMTPRQLADKAAEILYEAFGKDFAVKKDDGFRRYHVTRKDGSVQGLKEGQMVMTVQPDGLLMIRLNSPEGDVLYKTNKLSNADFKNELPRLKAFIADGVALPSTSKFIKEKNTSGYSDQDIKEILKGYQEDPKGSKPR